VEVLDEIRVFAERIEDTGVMVVGLSGGEQDHNSRALGCYGQAIGEGIVGVSVRPQQELPLGAAPGDHVRATRKDFAREWHTYLSAPLAESCLERSTWERFQKINLGEVPGEISTWERFLWERFLWENSL